MRDGNYKAPLSAGSDCATGVRNPGRWKVGLLGEGYSNSLGPVLAGARFSGGLGLGGCVPRRV